MGRNFNPSIKVFEMYPTDSEVIKSKKTIPQYPDEYTYANTRLKTITETRAEIDKLDFDKAMKVINEICLSLVYNQYHFAVFYSKGQRSPHIIIYDLEELSLLNPFKREKAQVLFWRKICPFSIQWLDHGVNADNHPVPMEFAPHWKTGNTFDLLFEYIPEVKVKEKEKEIILETKEETIEEKHQRYIRNNKQFNFLKEETMKKSNELHMEAIKCRV